MDPTWEKVLFIALGWILGLSSPLIVDALKRRQEAKAILSALQIELKELRYRMAVVYYLIHIRLGTIDKAILNWVRPIMANYDGLNTNPDLLRAIDGLLAAPDDQWPLLAERFKSSAGSALSLKKYPAPLLDTRSAMQLDTKLQNRLNEIRVFLSLFHEEVDQARYYMQQTFNRSLTDSDHQRVNINLLECQKNAAVNAKTIADHIGDIEW